MNKFEFKNLVKNLKDSLKEKTFFKELRKEVETGANGTQDYVVKKGVNKDTIATTIATIINCIIVFFFESKSASLPSNSILLLIHKLTEFLYDIACDALQNTNSAANNTGKKSPTLERGLFSPPINVTKIIKTNNEIDNGIMVILKFENMNLTVLLKNEFE